MKILASHAQRTGGKIAPSGKGKSLEKERRGAILMLLGRVTHRLKKKTLGKFGFRHTQSELNIFHFSPEIVPYMNGIRYFYRTYIVQYVLEHKIAYGIRNSTKYEKSFRTERYTERNGTEHMLCCTPKPPGSNSRPVGSLGTVT